MLFELSLAGILLADRAKERGMYYSRSARPAPPATPIMDRKGNVTAGTVKFKLVLDAAPVLAESPEAARRRWRSKGSSHPRRPP
ncbi:MAG: hypothetical protein K2W96_19260 [Gemmataceae bacterium]|nr:hypothetical protein [Gemmataceae bacterium]